MADVMGGTSTANQSAAGDSLQNNSQSLRFHSGAGVRGGSGDASALIADGAISKARPSNAAAKSEYHPQPYGAGGATGSDDLLGGDELIDPADVEIIIQGKP